MALRGKVKMLTRKEWIGQVIITSPRIIRTPHTNLILFLKELGYPLDYEDNHKQ